MIPLLDPPSGVGAELPPLIWVEAFHSLHETNVTLGDKVEKAETEARIILGDLDHESQVGRDHLLASLLVPFADAPGQLNFLGLGEERNLGDLLKVYLQGIFFFDGHGKI